jgi:outer membrane protein OmpA-like peptidoglycan-associated protein
MKKLILAAIMLSVASLLQAKVLMIANFDSKKEINQLGGAMGAWLGFPNDDSQGCWADFTERVRWGDKGASLLLRYDVESSNPAFNGYWMKLQNADARPYTMLVVFIKGDPDLGFPTEFNIELKNAKEVGRYMIKGVNSRWQKFEIPFSAMRGITDFSALNEFVIVFAQDSTDNKKGAIYIDDLCFSDGKSDPYEASRAKAEVVQIFQEGSGLTSVAEDAAKTGLEVRQEKDSVVVTVHINFDSGKYALRKGEKGKVKQVGELLNKYPNKKVDIVGFTDSAGSKKQNYELSEKRASAVREELILLGIKGNKLVSKGLGAMNPVAGNDTPAGRARNRRVEFIIKD